MLSKNPYNQDKSYNIQATHSITVKMKMWRDRLSGKNSSARDHQLGRGKVPRLILIDWDKFILNKMLSIEPIYPEIMLVSMQFNIFNNIHHQKLQVSSQPMQVPACLFANIPFYKRKTSNLFSSVLSTQIYENLCL